MLAAYWRPGGIEVFRIKGQEKIRLASGANGALTLGRGLGKKALIVSRELLLYTRKRYPPTTIENIKKALEGELRDLFPLEKPAFFARIFEATAAHCFVDIWAWETTGYEKLRSVFPFTHVVPEDLLFVSEAPELTVFGAGDFIHIIAHNKDGFMGGTTVKRLSGNTLADNTLELFLRSIRTAPAEIKKINSYLGDTKLNIFEAGTVVDKQTRLYPPCLDKIQGLALKAFKVEGPSALRARLELFQRAAIYFVVIYSLALFITRINYDRALEEVSAKLGSLSGGLAATKTSTGGADINSDIIKALLEKQSNKMSLLPVMETLAQALPDGSYLQRLVLNENRLELIVASKEPLSAVKSLATAGCLKNATLKGAPYKDSEGYYNFQMTAELKTCN